MSTVIEIQEAAARLDEAGQEQLLSWLLDQEAAWDQQIDKDAAAGKLDFLIEQAKVAMTGKMLRDWPNAAR